ncbi:hypothetical protein EVAR_9518_1 [Eumeta japonica]|uniref:Uncharacterized protein n=1 Tax=Eumeta variegata TaxID=151549 RepID=A0A4C1U4A2_EUMVA|nr:hypothetical protein EVAR_9518_1 [Eumeta japonica]
MISVPCASISSQERCVEVGEGSARNNNFQDISPGVCSGVSIQNEVLSTTRDLDSDDDEDYICDDSDSVQEDESDCYSTSDNCDFESEFTLNSDPNPGSARDSNFEPVFNGILLWTFPVTSGCKKSENEMVTRVATDERPFQTPSSDESGLGRSCDSPDSKNAWWTGASKLDAFGFATEAMVCVCCGLSNLITVLLVFGHFAAILSNFETVEWVSTKTTPCQTNFCEIKNKCTGTCTCD